MEACGERTEDAWTPPADVSIDRPPFTVPRLRFQASFALPSSIFPRASSLDPPPWTMDIAAQPLPRSFLLGSAWNTGRDVVRALGAVQAQDYDGAKWALSQRTPRVTDEAIEQEFTAGSILRTHVLRPTWHFVDPADIRWMLALTGPCVSKRMAPYDRKVGLDDRNFRTRMQ